MFALFRQGNHFDASKAEQAESYRAADPFPHIVLDDVFNVQALRDVIAEVPDPRQADAFRAELPLLQERKYAWRDVSRLGPNSLRLINALGSQPFLDYLSTVTGIEGLMPDPYLQGAGFHQILRGGRLAIHADFNTHRKTGLYRRLNLLLYLNERWEQDWGGQLELWDEGMTRCVRRVDPLFNRVVVFSTTPTSYHGHPDPLECPENELRRSLALYYYTYERLQEEPHATLWQARPGDSDEAVRAVRVSGGK
nr:2OG-Fe(II) oxygenase [Brevundimonas diminuta]